MDSERRLLILYGSQTGCAQEVAERIWRESKWLYYNGPIVAMDDYPIEKLIFEKKIIFVCSTTGQGDQPDNMKITWKFLLRKNLPSNSLKNVEFAVLGLGDSSYVKFNHVAKKLYRRLIQLGGKPVCNIGLADDQHDIGAFAVIDPWINNLWNVLTEIHSLADGLIPIDRNTLPPPKWNVHSSKDTVHIDERLPNNDLFRTNSSIVTCLSNTKTTAENHFQDVRLLKFECTDQNVKYFPGDVLMVRPVNSEKSVNNFFDLFKENKKMKLDPTTILSVTQRSNDMPVPYNLCKPFTLFQCAKYYWDLNIIPNRYTFQLLSYFTDSELEKEKLQEFTTPEGQEELYNYCNRPRRTILEVLTDFPHATANLSLEYLFEIFSSIRPRAFSIASAPSVHINEIHLLVAVVTYKTKLLTKRIGLCSTWLSSLKCDDKIPVWIQKGSFKFPYSHSCHSIMIGPGTGVAPFRSFVHESIVKGYGDAKTLYLYFGARNRYGDFHFVNDWEKLVANGKLSLFTAFSRDQDHKIYVQHILEQKEEELYKLLSSKECYVFVAGNAKNMPTAVKDVFIKIFEKFENLSNTESIDTLEIMESKGFYQTETWN
ncbi:Riboflavin synthase-like beta-barrel,Flavoprotein pyridine nucleotide cytochrome [Cinara cedri]|uniref:NADPH-dependent diflavin oxidoreductase 1 n=1 Tax=Cinara cedri TaxID=506608 RepID=A0A5E4N143_9HEMI|nr:Riboflavin synthase-like beta-barrel,Flavoprotein pyridine nucleotide cytochrome [Cinara cedri]